MRHRAMVALACTIMVAAASGCGIFKSSTSEASSESSSKVSSSSSPGGGSSFAYQRDVRDYTASYAAASRDLERFQRDLGVLAEGYGVTDWEHDRITFVAIGQGLARTDMDAEAIAAFETGIASAHPERLGWLRTGYEDERRW